MKRDIEKLQAKNYYSMGLAVLKKELFKLEKSDLIKLIIEMYKNVPLGKEYLDIYSGDDIKKYIKKYKKLIVKYVFPSGRTFKVRDSEARNMIKSVGKMGIIELNIELEMYFSECCLEVLSEYGDFSNSYYTNVQRYFYSAVNNIEKLGLEEVYDDRINSLLISASEVGLILEY